MKKKPKPEVVAWDPCQNIRKLGPDQCKNLGDNRFGGEISFSKLKIKKLLAHFLIALELNI